MFWSTFHNFFPGIFNAVPSGVSKLVFALAFNKANTAFRCLFSMAIKSGILSPVNTSQPLTTQLT
jgi:hypothetical protein